MAEKKFEIGEAVSFGWRTAKENIVLFLVVVLVIWAVQAIFNWPSYLRGDAYYILMPIFTLINWVVNCFVAMAVVRISLRFNKGETAELEDLWMGYPKFLGFFAAYLLYGLLVLAGFILLIIPGIYWAVKYQFYAYFIMERDMAPIEALKASGEITRGSWWNLFWLGILSGLIAIAGACACCVGLFWALPTVLVAHGYAYMRLSGAVPPAALQEPAAPAPVAPAPVAPAPSE